MSDPEAVDRMCKKISQLTRVIYLLNTKNDESNALIKALYKTYDKEMETLRKNANDTISNLQKKIDKSKDNSAIDNKVKEIRKKYDDSCVAFMNSIDKFKREVKKNEDNIKKEYDEKYKMMIEEVQKVKKDADNKIKNYLKKYEDEKKKLSGMSTEEVNKLKQDLENMKKNYENEIKKLKLDNHKNNENLKKRL